MKNIALLIFMIFSLIEVSHLTAQTGVKLLLEGPNDAKLSDGTGILQIGSSNGSNVIFDRNEILARNNGTNSTLFLNMEGGNVTTGGYIKTGNDNWHPLFKVYHIAGIVPAGGGIATINLNSLPAGLTSDRMLIVQVNRQFNSNSLPVPISAFNPSAITLGEILPQHTAYRVTVVYTDL